MTTVKVVRSWIAGPRRRSALAVVAAVALLALASAWTSQGAPAVKPETGALTLRSPAFPSGGRIPINYSCTGANMSPPLSWHGVAPPGTLSWAIVMRDLDVRSATWIQWSVTGIAADTRTVGAGQVPKGSVTNRASNGTVGFVGVCPPQGKVHHYQVTVFAMSKPVTFSASTMGRQSLQNIESASVGRASLVGRFAR